MAVVRIDAVEYDQEPGHPFPAAVEFGKHYVLGRKRTRKGYYPIIGHTWHIVGATIDRWSSGSPVPLCSGFVGYHGKTPVSVRGFIVEHDRICKTCLKVVESRARARGAR